MNVSDNYLQEIAILQTRIDRLEKYIEVIAKKTGVDLLALGID
jgi:hypothetical protein